MPFVRMFCVQASIFLWEDEGVVHNVEQEKEESRVTPQLRTDFWPNRLLANFSVLRD